MEFLLGNSYNSLQKYKEEKSIQLNREICSKCNGTGRLPEYPKPYVVLPANIIDSIKRNAPICENAKVVDMKKRNNLFYLFSPKPLTRP